MEEVRDWLVTEAISDLGEDSWDFVGRDILVDDGEELYQVDMIKYRKEGYLIKAKWVCDGTEETEREAMENLRGVGDLLRSEGYRTILTKTDKDSVKPGYSPNIKGNYFIDNEKSLAEINMDLEGLVHGDLESEDYDRIECES